MQLKNKIAVVTGGGSGIGAALAARFMAEGARQVVVVDLHADNAAAVAKSLGCIAMAADVAREQDVLRVIEDTEAQIGPIDLFCSNAGVGLGASPASPNEEWQASWDINVMAHVYAARHLVPRMVARGGGYFLNTASAAGLLNQIGGAAYGVTKHAAVGFAEWLAMHHAHEGIKVSLLCPQAVRTPMTAGDDDGIAAASVDGMMEPEELADIVVAALDEEKFLILTHSEVQEYMRRKTLDYDRWIAGMNRLMKKIVGID
ncbi:MAG: SDR family oxidoreductase [Gammaproteobacteria bacterium]|nr:SDR family oxidoreductase [Gammaproteobacteria bacterium]NND40186.1 SDR family oxidoreductase [Pseudomonadales bacterium]NNM11522.1 SDR family oxidoreductase [Pseudomonadales bacterium]RZV59564.1 MAG: SDR family oxidoreductase [Pseudomonadales bacterium]